MMRILASNFLRIKKDFELYGSPISYLLTNNSLEKYEKELIVQQKEPETLIFSLLPLILRGSVIGFYLNVKY